MCCLDQTYSFKNRDLLMITKNADNLCTAVFLETLYKISRTPKFLRTLTLKNISERLLLNVFFNSNEEQHLVVKLDEMG